MQPSSVELKDIYLFFLTRKNVTFKRGIIWVPDYAITLKISAIYAITPKKSTNYATDIKSVNQFRVKSRWKWAVFEEKVWGWAVENFWPKSQAEG